MWNDLGLNLRSSESISIFKQTLLNCTFLGNSRENDDDGDNNNDSDDNMDDQGDEAGDDNADNGHDDPMFFYRKRYRTTLCGI